MHKSQKQLRPSIFVALVVVFLYLQGATSSASPPDHIYKTGTQFSLKFRWFGLSAEGTMTVMDKTEIRGKEVVLVRSHVAEMSGFMGFIVKLLRIYKESDTFDSYIDPDKHLTVRYEVYKQDDDGSKTPTEHVYFDREKNMVLSFDDHKPIIYKAAPRIQDGFSIFLDLLYRFNTEKVFVGKKFETNLYAYKKISKLEVEVTGAAETNGKEAFVLEIKKLPAVFKFPASVSFEVQDVGNGFNLPTKGKCTIELRALPDIKIYGTLREVKRAG